MTDGAVVDDAGAFESWQQRAVERSLSRARAKALQRSARFLEVAVKLMDETGGVDFTVQELVNRSKLSLRAFYQHFDGKDDLLLALFEEQMSRFLQRLEADIQELDDPVSRMDAFIEHYFRSLVHPEVPQRSGRALTAFHLRLAATAPEAYARALQPQIAMMTQLIEEGVEAGVYRTDMDPTNMALLLNTTMVSIAQMGILHVHAGTPLDARQVAAWCRSALMNPDPRPTPGKTKRTRAKS